MIHCVDHNTGIYKLPEPSVKTQQEKRETGFLHKFKSIWRRSNKETSWFQPLAGVPQHHMGLLLTLKRIVINKLTAADVKLQLGIIQLL